jgi:hypothetical protein
MDAGIATGRSFHQCQPQPSRTYVETVQAFRIGMLKWVVPALAVLLALTVFFLYFEIRQSIRSKNSEQK